ncbi:Type I restriction-modification system, specificity subunit S [Tenacibaculum sp. 190130A14a]|uniref:Type I restriction enzyme, S subunit n=1 Tax=Tenacibaculum polynesiense TaxID=3137857 RepID=A0ABM9P8G5_9FLAO
MELATKQGFKQTEIGLIPEDWRIRELDHVLKFGSGQDYKHLSKGDIPVYGTGGIMTYVNNHLYNGESVGIGRKGTIDKPVFLSGKFWTVDTLFYTKDFLDSIPKFIYYKFLIIPWKEYNEASGVPSLNKNTLGKIKIALPPTLKEQKAIATALSDVDDLIASLESLIAKKQAIKQGAMQQLLTPPHKGGKRLPGFSGEWMEKSLTELAWFQEGPGLRKWQFTTKGIKVINITNLVDGYLDLDKTTRHISWDEFHKMYKHFEVDEHDIVVASSGNSYCKTSIVRQQDLPLVMNTSVIRFKPNSIMNYQLLLILLKSSQFKKQIDLLITGGAQPNFGPVHLPKVFFSIPESKEEQKAIAEILSDMDAEIAQLETKKAKYQQLKQGMMQELLTGKTRLV